MTSSSNAIAASALLGLSVWGCTSEGRTSNGLASFRVEVISVNGDDLPSKDDPLPANRGNRDERWTFRVQALNERNEALAFDGPVRLSVVPGALLGVSGAEVEGRNLWLRGGKAEGEARVRSVYGPSRLWVTDLGYDPADAGETPACANHQNDDAEDDILVDYPADPGCAFGNDASEAEGSYSVGVSQPIQYALPSIADVQGPGSSTPYAFETVDVKTASPQNLVVTRLTQDGFYVSDVGNPEPGSHSLFVFNYATPYGTRICDELSSLSGVLVEFFGFTELSFPSFRIRQVNDMTKCRVPAPVVLAPEIVSEGVEMERLESALVEARGCKVPKFFGQEPAVDAQFGPNRSSCDLNGDGQVDFLSPAEATCSGLCNADDECTEYTSFDARGNFKVRCEGGVIQLNLNAAPEIQPRSLKGQSLGIVRGTLRNFSGGDLNWTLEARCPDDVVACEEGEAFDDCAKKFLPLNKACVRQRTGIENEAVN